jgi:peptidoglycan/LPS O-acetylase OafA/YrhL
VLHGVYQFAVLRPDDAWWYAWAVHLDIGVSIFFTISGFLLYRPFLRATLTRTPVDVRAYAWRRFVRIVPAYWVALAVIAFWSDLQELQSAGGALRYGLFAQVYDSQTALRGMGQAWSLDVEVAFYVVMPLFALAISRARTFRAAVLGCLGFAAVGVLWKALALGVVDYSTPGTAAWFYTLPGHMDALGGGMLVAVAALWVREGRALPRAIGAVAARPWLAWAAAAALFALVGAVADGGMRNGPLISDPQYLVTRVLYAVIGVLLLLPAALPGDGRGRVRALLRSAPLRGLGVVSYSFYLWHYAAIGQVARWWDGLPSGAGWVLWVAATFALSLAIATASYWLVERPFMRLRTVVPGRRRAAAPDAVQAAP